MKGLRKKSRLTMKMVFGEILLGVLICLASSLTGYHQYKNTIQKQYNTTAYQCCSVEISYVGQEQIEEYVQIINDYRDGKVTEDDLTAYRESEEYQTIKKQVENLRESMGANDVFLFVLDEDELLNYQGTRDGWTPLYYIFDSYTQPELSYVLGNSSSFNPDYITELSEIAKTGERSDSYFISKGDYGYNTAAIEPIKDEDGNVIAMAAVEIPMVTLQSALRQYVLYAILVTIALIVVFIVVYSFYIFRTVVRPINIISKEARDFVENGNRVSEAVSKIKTHDEIQELAEDFKKMQGDIQQLIRHISRVTAEKERIGAELGVAAHIQSSMLPCIFPAFPGRKEIDIYATMNPAKEVGGDFYDFFMVDDSHLAIVMADVSGKGVPAALFMVIAKTLLKDHTVPGTDLGAVFMEVNELLCQSNSEGMFVTVFEGVLDLKTGEFRYANAGHEIPFICKKGEGFSPYKIRAGFVLAGMEGMRYKSGSITLEPGDRIFQYTDGVTEATDAQKQLFGMERLEASLNVHKDLSVMELLPAVKADIDAFVGEAEQFDDITMLCLEYKERMEGEP